MTRTTPSAPEHEFAQGDFRNQAAYDRIPVLEWPTPDRQAQPAAHTHGNTTRSEHAQPVASVPVNQCGHASESDPLASSCGGRSQEPSPGFPRVPLVYGRMRGSRDLIFMLDDSDDDDDRAQSLKILTAAARIGQAVLLACMGTLIWANWPF